MELLLIRHGRPLAERESGPGEGADPPLTGPGRAEAALLGAHLAAGHRPTPDVVFTSPMRRARETAAEITSRLDVPLHVDDRLREFDHGAASYTPPELSTAGHAERRALWRALETGVWGGHRFDPDAFEHRVAEVFAEIVDAHSASVVAVVCHSGVINSFLGAVLERPRGMFFLPDYTALSRVAASRDGRRQVLSLNETGHLLPRAREVPAMTPDPRLLVLHTLRLGGFVAADRVAARTDLAADTVAGVLGRAHADGHATERTGRIAGWVLTPAGRAEHAALLAAELEALDARASVEEADRAFVALNQPFKELCTRWQIRPDGSPNDHSDAAYDRAVVADVEPVHRAVVELTGTLAATVARFARYPRAFTDAHTRMLAGEVRAFAAPLAESYHDAWMELHQDLLSTLGRERAAADGH